jgi:hypothetical protein
VALPHWLTELVKEGDCVLVWLLETQAEAAGDCVEEAEKEAVSEKAEERVPLREAEGVRLAMGEGLAV